MGWVVVCILDECIAVSLGELASRYPTSAGPYYWSFQLANRGKVLLSYLTGWVWLVGNWTITLSVNFGFASLLAATVAIYKEDWEATSWELLLIFYAVLMTTFMICTFGNRFLPMVDTFCAAFTLITILVVLVALSVKADAGRHSAAYALGHYDTSLSGYGGFTWFIGLLPAAYTFSALGMISSMAEEVSEPTRQVPMALSLCVPVGGVAGLFFVLPICFTLPDMADIFTNAPYAQGLPYIFHKVMGTPGGATGLSALVLIITLFCSISITTAASRCTWAFARDKAIPLSRLWSHVNPKLEVPVWALMLTTVVQMLLGLINLGSTVTFTAFISVGVIALALSYAIPIVISMLQKRHEVEKAPWNCGKLGWVVNWLAVIWIGFETVIFSMPTVLPVIATSMNYASVVLVGFMTMAAIWYVVHARKVYHGPPLSGL